MINHVNNWEKANQEKNNESFTAELERYKERVKTFEQPQRIKPTLYDGSVISSQHVASLVFDDEEILILKELNQLSEDFGKCFVPQQELSDEQAFWLQTSYLNTDQSTSSPVKIKAPRELPKSPPNLCQSLRLKPPPLSIELVFCSGRQPDTAYPPVGYDMSNSLPRYNILISAV
ncbi:hypothetical protein Tco_0803960 [Tanacetum coccineum]|uniref:Uncharacterized protein n=1 Tax=Tanacetum coccineum TaxID=301880 RepID=A0ABQ5A3Y8_9ASTR